MLENPRALPEGTKVEIFPVSDTPTIKVGAELERLAGLAENLPADLAEKHDHYRSQHKS